MCVTEMISAMGLIMAPRKSRAYQYLLAHHKEESNLVAQIFGVRHLSALAGIVFLSHQVGAFLGAWLAGVAFDLTGSYGAIWIISIILAVMAALVMAHEALRTAWAHVLADAVPADAVQPQHRFARCPRYPLLVIAQARGDFLARKGAIDAARRGRD